MKPGLQGFRINVMDTGELFKEFVYGDEKHRGVNFLSPLFISPQCPAETRALSGVPVKTDVYGLHLLSTYDVPDSVLNTWHVEAHLLLTSTW